MDAGVTLDTLFNLLRQVLSLNLGPASSAILSDWEIPYLRLPDPGLAEGPPYFSVLWMGFWRVKLESLCLCCKNFNPAQDSAGLTR